MQRKCATEMQRKARLQRECNEKGPRSHLRGISRSSAWRWSALGKDLRQGGAGNADADHAIARHLIVCSELGMLAGVIPGLLAGLLERAAAIRLRAKPRQRDERSRRQSWRRSVDPVHGDASAGDQPCGHAEQGCLDPGADGDGSYCRYRLLHPAAPGEGPAIRSAGCQAAYLLGRRWRGDHCRRHAMFVGQQFLQNVLGIRRLTPGSQSC